MCICSSWETERSRSCMHATLPIHLFFDNPSIWQSLHIKRLHIIHPFLPFPLPSVHTLSWSLWPQTHSAYNHQQALTYIISLVLFHARNTTLSVSFWNISKFCVPVVDEKASLPNLQNPRLDLIVIYTNPVHIFTTQYFVNVYYLAFSFDLKYRSLSGHCTRTWMHTETENH